MNWTAFTAQNPFLWQAAKVNRGYTFHEQLDPVGLVHMNGRVYDPEIGRFLSADPFVQDISNFQAFNAYSYVQNNPLSFTDPSGFFLSGLFKKIGRVLSNIGRGFMGLARTIARSSIGRAVLQIAACYFGGPYGCAAAAAGLTLAAGGTIKQAIIGAALSFAQAGAYDVIGGVVAGMKAAGDLVGSALFKIATHAIVGGAASLAQGGSFETGAFTGAIAAGTSLSMDGTALGNAPGEGGVIARTAIAAIAGGTASVLAGGKFANGAITGAMAHLFNWETSQQGMRGTQSGEASGASSANQSTQGEPGSTAQCFADCAMEHYGLGGLMLRGGVAAASVPFPKSWIDAPVVMGASKNTNLLSAFGYLNPSIDAKIGARILGTTRVFGIAGRAIPFVGLGILSYDAASITYCTYNCMNHAPEEDH